MGEESMTSVTRVIKSPELVGEVAYIPKVFGELNSVVYTLTASKVLYAVGYLVYRKVRDEKCNPCYQVS